MRQRACNTPPHAYRSVVVIDHLERGGRHPSAPQTRSGRGILGPPSRKKYSLPGRMGGVFFFFPSPPLPEGRAAAPPSLPSSLFLLSSLRLWPWRAPAACGPSSGPQEACRGLGAQLRGQVRLGHGPGPSCLSLAGSRAPAGRLELAGGS